jgi:hypothetical protein
MADDDYCEPDLVERLVETALSDREIVLSACDVTVVDAADIPTSTVQLVGARPGQPWIQVRRRFFRYPTSNIFFCIYGLFRLDALRLGLPLLEPGWKNYGTNNEVPFLAKIATRGKIVAIARPLKYYRSHEDSIYQREAGRIPPFDGFMVKTIIRLRLLRIAILSEIPLSERMICVLLVLYDATRLKPSSLRSGVRRCLPAPIVKLMKNFFK